jgi:hypothetical protein
MRAAMAEASRAVLAGFELATEPKSTVYPDRYMDERGATMWRRVIDLAADNAQRQGRTA